MRWLRRFEVWLDSLCDAWRRCVMTGPARRGRVEYMVIAEGGPYDPDYVVPPGDTLCEKLDDLGITNEEAARAMEMSVDELEDILCGERPLLVETAERMECLTGIPKGFWLERDRIYWSGSGQNYTRRCDAEEDPKRKAKV